MEDALKSELYNKFNELINVMVNYVNKNDEKIDSIQTKVDGIKKGEGILQVEATTTAVAAGGSLRKIHRLKSRKSRKSRKYRRRTPSNNKKI